MKYWSEILNELFDDEKSLQKAEQEYESKQKEKDIMHDRVIDAFKRSEAAREEYEKLQEEYINKYGSFVDAHNTKHSYEFPYAFFTLSK
jgi:hypothetical protein